MLKGYYEHRPNGPLAQYVHRMACMYFSEPLPPEPLAPDSFIKFTMILDGKPQCFNGAGELMDWHDGFCGHVPPEAGIVATAETPVRCVFVNMYPSGFHRLYRIAVHKFNGKMVRPAEVDGPRVEQLYADIRLAKGPDVVFALLEGMLTERLEHDDPKQPSPMQLAEQMVRESKGLITVTELSARTGTSARQLERRFKEEIGLSPKEFCSVVRFNHAYGHMRRTRTLDLGTALACGYYDESHMLRDLNYYIGKAPKRFAQVIRPMVEVNLGQLD